jgi:hypothetical protein
MVSSDTNHHSNLMQTDLVWQKTCQWQAKRPSILRTHSKTKQRETRKSGNGAESAATMAILASRGQGSYLIA